MSIVFNKEHTGKNLNINNEELLEDSDTFVVNKRLCNEDDNFSDIASKENNFEEDLGMEYLNKDGDYTSVPNKENFTMNKDEENDEEECDSNFSVAGFNEQPSSYYNNEPRLSKEQIMREKITYLRKLKKLEKQKRCPTKSLTINDSLEDIKAEYISLIDEMSCEKGVETCKHGVLFFTNLIETGNKALGSGFELEGWGNHMYSELNSGSYDQLLEEVYEKYLSNMDGDPLLKLVGSIGLSAITYHMSVKASKAMSSFSENISKGKKMKEPSINADDLLSKLNSDDISDTCSIITTDSYEDNKKDILLEDKSMEITSNVSKAKKRGRPAKNKKK